MSGKNCTKIVLYALSHYLLTNSDDGCVKERWRRWRGVKVFSVLKGTSWKT